MMDAHYAVADTSSVSSPALLFYKDLIRHNMQECIKLTGSPARLRPHCKTHKTREIIHLLLDAGVSRHKCATLAEAEMLAGCGVADILLAYPIVGPNCRRLAALVAANPDCWFTVLADHPAAVATLSEVIGETGHTVGVMLDLDVGQHRTGIAPGADAIALYEEIAQLPGLEPRGLHAYDGHTNQPDPAERADAVRRGLGPVLALRAELQRRGLPVPTLVAGGTPTFPMYAKMDIPGLECSPGTCLLHDHGYGSKFADMTQFIPAAALLTRVISKPTANRLTLDLGYKAVASDPPAGKRLVLVDFPGPYEQVLQSEEHLVIEAPAAPQFQPGAEFYAIPTHICPTCALHQHAHVVENGHITEIWTIAARDRILTV